MDLLLHHKPRLALRQAGYTLVELMIGIVLFAIISTIAYSLSNTTFSQYLYLQKDGSYFTDLASQSQRLANILRGITDFVDTQNNQVTVYAYFFPNNTYVSKIRYYLNTQGTILYADVTPMTANPPIGTPITANLKTYTVMPNFYKDPNVNLFQYLDSNGSTLSLPVSDEHIIKGITINLAVPGDKSKNVKSQSMSLTVSLRNRKTNL